MTRFRRYSSLASAALVLGAATARAQQAGAPPDWAAFDQYVAQAARDWHVPALAIAVVKDDSLVFARGYGVRQVDTQERADEHTRFAIGSTTKAMTSAALAMLVDEGKLHWDDHVIDYFPDFQLYDPWVTREVTIRDLLTHRTGLPGTDLLWTLDAWGYTLPDMMHRLQYVKPSASFRSDWQYQNVVYAISGVLIEQLSGMPWDAFIRKRILAPLGMTETEPLVADIVGKPNVAVPYVETNDTVRAVPIHSTDAIAPAGSVWSSVSDMSKWMRFMLDSGRVGTERLIQPATFRELVAPQIRAQMAEYPALQLAQPNFFSYALGWFVQDYRGWTIWMHTGSIDGMCALIALVPDERLGVYVLENLDHAELRHALMYRTLDLYNGGPSRDWSAELKTLMASMRTGAGRGGRGAGAATGAPASLALDRYAGTYVDSVYGTIRVTYRNDALQAEVGKAPAVELTHLAYEVFRTAAPDARRALALTFVPDGSGGISAVRISRAMFQRVSR
jgi:CubicO group peptidase (beta-lactamase class C family)